MEVFLDFIRLKDKGSFEEKANYFYNFATKNPKSVTNYLLKFLQYQKQRTIKGEISESTIPKYFKTTKLFCEMNEIPILWKRISKGIPQGRRSANDLVSTIEEIPKLLEYLDRRIKPFVMVMMSLMMQVGVGYELKWKIYCFNERQK